MYIIYINKSIHYPSTPLKVFYTLHSISPINIAVSKNNRLVYMYIHIYSIYIDKKHVFYMIVLNDIIKWIYNIYSSKHKYICIFINIYTYSINKKPF